MTDEIRKTLALISHDGKKADMIAFAMDHRDVLARYDLIATNTTGNKQFYEYHPKLVWNTIAG